MTDNEKLARWMEAHGWKNSTLAERMNVSYDYVYKLACGKAEVGNGFKWRFGEVFGFDEAQALFGNDELTPA